MWRIWSKYSYGSPVSGVEGFFLNHTKQNSEGVARGASDDTSQIVNVLAWVTVVFVNHPLGVILQDPQGEDKSPP